MLSTEELLIRKMICKIHEDGFCDGKETEKVFDRCLTVDDGTIEIVKVFTKAIQAEQNKYLDLKKSLEAELRDPNGTIWEHAKSLQNEIDELRKEDSDLRDKLFIQHKRLKDKWEECNELRYALDKAHEVFGTESDKLGKIIEGLHKENERLIKDRELALGNSATQYQQKWDFIKQNEELRKEKEKWEKAASEANNDYIYALQREHELRSVLREADKALINSSNLLGMCPCTSGSKEAKEIEAHISKALKESVKVLAILKPLTGGKDEKTT